MQKLLAVLINVWCFPLYLMLFISALLCEGSSWLCMLYTYSRSLLFLKYGKHYRVKFAPLCFTYFKVKLVPRDNIFWSNCCFSAGLSLFLCESGTFLSFPHPGLSSLCQIRSVLYYWGQTGKPCWKMDTRDRVQPQGEPLLKLFGVHIKTELHICYISTGVPCSSLCMFFGGWVSQRSRLVFSLHSPEGFPSSFRAFSAFHNSSIRVPDLRLMFGCDYLPVSDSCPVEPLRRQFY